MSRIAITIVLGFVAGFVLLAEPCRASLYSPEDAYAIPVSDDGTPVALSFDEFKRRLAVLKNLPNPNLEKNPDRERFLARIEAARRKDRKRTPAETAALAVELLRIARPEEAAGLLAAGDRQSYLSNMTLAHVNAALGDWATGTEYLTIANGQPMPTELAGLTSAQLAWQHKVNRGPLSNLFESRWQESRHRPLPEVEEVDPIFPMEFVNSIGVYEPGVLAPSQRAKLPSDAVAVVQQLLLWFPNDARLYWLLGEVYAATGDIRLGRRIMDDCVSEAWKYGNRKVLQLHRQAVVTAAEASPKVVAPEDTLLVQPTETPPQPGSGEKPPISMETIGLYFGVVGLIAVLALVRTVMKRR